MNEHNSHSKKVYVKNIIAKIITTTTFCFKETEKGGCEISKKDKNKLKKIYKELLEAMELYTEEGITIYEKRVQRSRIIKIWDEIKELPSLKDWILKNIEKR